MQVAGENYGVGLKCFFCGRVKIDPLDPYVTVGNNRQVHLQVLTLCEKFNAKLQTGKLNLALN